jgi:hypothetical protein
MCGWLGDIFSWPFGAIAALIKWATTPTGLRAQAVGAFVCQLVGFAILVSEVIEARGDFRRVIDRFRRIDRAMATEIKSYQDAEYWRKEPTIVALMDRGKSLSPDWHHIGRWLLDAYVGAFVVPPFRMGLALYAGMWAKLHEVVVQNDVRKHPWRPWVGAVFLFFGILMSFSGQFLGIR